MEAERDKGTNAVVLVVLRGNLANSDQINAFEVFKTFDEGVMPFVFCNSLQSSSLELEAGVGIEQERGVFSKSTTP